MLLSRSEIFQIGFCSSGIPEVLGILFCIFIRILLLNSTGFMLFEYLWTVFILIILEGLLSADNALVLAVLVKHLPAKQRKKALTYGIWGAFGFRFLAIILASWLIVVWQAQAVGALYLLYVAFRHLVFPVSEGQIEEAEHTSFWKTVISVEIADIAFSIDSILAAVALVQSLPPSDWEHIGGLDGGRFLVVIIGGILGIITMRFVAGFFIELMQKYPGLEKGAYLIVGWIGLKLALVTLCHPGVGLLPEDLPTWLSYKIIFWTGLVGMFAGSMLWKPKPPKA